MPTGDTIAPGGCARVTGESTYTAGRETRPEFVLDLGLWYMIFTAFALGLLFHVGGVPTSGIVFPEISWVGAVVLIFAAIVPTAPTKMLIAGLIAASMNPAGMLISKAQGTWDFGPWTGVLLMHYPDFIIVGAAVVISHVVTSSVSGHREREMGSYQLGDGWPRGMANYKATIECSRAGRDNADTD